MGAGAFPFSRVLSFPLGGWFSFIPASLPQGLTINNFRAGHYCLPDVVGVRVGSLDDPSGYRPTMDMFVASAQPWDHMNPELPKFPGYPPGVGSKRM